MDSLVKKRIIRLLMLPNGGDRAINQALGIYFMYCSEHDPSNWKVARMLRFRFHTAQHDFIMRGFIAYDTFIVEKNKIVNALFEIVCEVDIDIGIGSQ